jgi:hypothetical protein
MDNEQLNPYKGEANIIQLNDDKILKEENYQELSNEVSAILNSDYNI